MKKLPGLSLHERLMTSAPGVIPALTLSIYNTVAQSRRAGRRRTIPTAIDRLINWPARKLTKGNE